MNNCIYCRNEICGTHPIVVENEKDTLCCCSEPCKKKVLAFYSFYNRTKIIFIIGMVISIVVLFISAVLLSIEQKLMGSILMGVSIVLLGTIIILFPFATPQTFKLIGLRKTVWFTRLVGLCLVVLGILLAYWVRT